MKKVLLILCVQLALIGQSQAQNAMKDLLNSVKDQVKKASDDAKTQVKSQANDAVAQAKGKANDAVAQAKGKATDAVNQAKGKVTDEADEELNNIVIVSQKKLSSVTNIAMPSINAKPATKPATTAPVNNAPATNANEPQVKNILEPDAIEMAMQKDYPLFYHAYQQFEKDDKTIKNIIFGYKEDHQYQSISYPKKGIIFFDLYYFEDNRMKERQAIFDLFEMIAYIHYHYDFPEEKDQVRRHVYTFEYILKASKEFAEKNECGPLKVVINAIKKRTAKPEESNNPKDPAAKIVSEGQIYKDCVEYLNTKCKG
jgi:Sec-independent protein translocase protein TatA